MKRSTIWRYSLTVFLTALFTVGHVFYSWWFSLVLYQYAGGIHKLPSGWTQFGGASYAWAIPLELPGSILLRLCELGSSSDCAGTFVAQGSLLLLLVASVATAYSLAAILGALISRRPIPWGFWYWRAIILILGLAWIPVREDFAPVFQYTVAY
jgi:hypothetical protein